LTKSKHNYRFPEEQLVNWLQYAPPMDVDSQFALLWNYRRALTVIEMQKREIAEIQRLREAADKARDEMGMALQQWIKEHPIKKTTS
jgi:hypothetical protein